MVDKTGNVCYNIILNNKESEMTLQEQQFEDEVFDFLDNLRESGATNMFGAGPFVQEEFGLERREASQFVGKWMKTFSERHPK